MKHVFLVIFLMFSTLGFTQEINQNLKDFDKIIVEGLKVKLVQGTENKMSVSGISKEKVTYSIKDNTLHLKLSTFRVNDDNTTAVVYFKNLESIHALKLSEVSLMSLAKQDKFSFDIEGGADVIASINVKDLKAHIVTGGNLSISGKAEHQELELSARGTFKGENFFTESTNINLNSGGKARINSAKKVIAQASAGGNIYVYGNPEILEKKTSFGASIKEIN